MDLRDYLKIIRKRGWIIVSVALIAATVAVGVSQLQTPVYRASIQLGVEPARLDYGLSSVIKDIMRYYVIRLSSHQMAQKVIDRAQLDTTTDELLSKLSISSDPSTYTIRIDVKDTDPLVAQQTAQTIAELFVEDRVAWNQDQDKQDRVDVSIIDNVRQAELFSPKTKTNAAAGLIFGGLVGGLVVFVLEWLESDIVRRPEDVERTVGWTVLGTIPAMPGQRMAGRSSFPFGRKVPRHLEQGKAGR